MERKRVYRSNFASILLKFCFQFYLTNSLHQFNISLYKSLYLLSIVCNSRLIFLRYRKSPYSLKRNYSKFWIRLKLAYSVKKNSIYIFIYVSFTQRSSFHWHISLFSSRTRSGAGQPRASAGLRAALERGVLERHRGDDPLLGPWQSLAEDWLADGRWLAGSADTEHPWDAGEWIHVFPTVRRGELPARRTLGRLSMPGVE